AAGGVSPEGPTDGGDRGARRENTRSERTFIDGLPQAYPVHGDAAFVEPCLVVAREDGARGVRLSFVEDRVRDEGGKAVLELVFHDELTGLVVEQRCVVFRELDVVARSVTVR